jgi:hypothetical protein
MSSLPSEILDLLGLIVDHLHDEPTTLKVCCVVSKSWIHRTRTLLFATVDFWANKSSIERWKKTFPDPSHSPAHHTRTLFISDPPHVVAADADEGGWIRAFRNVVHLYLGFFDSEDPRVSLVPFHGLSPTLRSLYLVNTSMEVLDLICSFPLLEDLELASLRHGSDTWNTPSTSPKLTGSLSLTPLKGIRPIVRRLMGLPNGLHFTKIMIAGIDEDDGSTTDLVLSCSDTLESLSVYCSALGPFPFSLREWSIPYRYSWI